MNLLAELTAEDCAALLPEWRGAVQQIHTLTGGITNRLYRVQLADGGDYVVRCYGEKTELFIDREIEKLNIERLAETGVTPRLVRYLPEQRVTVVEYLPGRPLRNEDFLRAELWPQIVAPIRRIHGAAVVLPRSFEPLAEVTRLHGLYRELGLQHDGYDLSGSLEQLGRLAARAAVPVSSYVPCHNDLLADNFIARDLAAGGEPVIALIDWEYAGMSTPYYDLADMLQEILVPAEVERELLRCYWGEQGFDDHLRRTEMHKPFADLYWTLWSLIQREVSSLAFDYASYGRSKYDNARAQLRQLQQRGWL